MQSNVQTMCLGTVLRHRSGEGYK